MGQLVEGIWNGEDLLNDSKGSFKRQQSSFRNFIGEKDFAPEKDRYHLYISYACPWACRAAMMRSLKNLEDIISMSSVDAVMHDLGWSFKEAGSSCDPLYQLDHLHQIYTMAEPLYTGRVTVPVLWDKNLKTIVNNESSEILRMLNCQFNEFSKDARDYYPEKDRLEIDKVNDFVYKNINNGVYKCGFATSQGAYNQAYENLFESLDTLDVKLSTQTYLIGEQLTEADIRLFTTLVRFDSAYFTHFKCNKRLLQSYKNLDRYLKQIYQLPKIAETVQMEHIKEHYYLSHKNLNPSGIIPKGPLVNFL